MNRPKTTRLAKRVTRYSPPVKTPAAEEKAAGDKAARKGWATNFLRAGGATLQWVAEADIRRLRWIPAAARQAAKRALMLVEIVSEERRVPGGWWQGGWYPDHVSVTACPRGHPWLRETDERSPLGHMTYNFRLYDNAGVTATRDVVNAGDGFVKGFLVAGGELDYDDSMQGVLTIECKDCYAEWPFPEGVELDFE